MVGSPEQHRPRVIRSVTVSVADFSARKEVAPDLPERPKSLKIKREPVGRAHSSLWKRALGASIVGAKKHGDMLMRKRTWSNT